MQPLTVSEMLTSALVALIAKLVHGTHGRRSAGMFELHYLGQKVQTFRTRDAAMQNILESAGSFGDYEILDESDNL